MLRYEFDFVIIGSGLAGLYSALYASQFGQVALLTKSTLNVSNSYWAQGGIAAAVDATDSPNYHFNDTIEAGGGLCDEKAVRILVEEGKERIEELIKGGMKFDVEKGALALGLEGGHKKRRVLHAGGDSTGREIVNFVIHKVKEAKNIRLFENLIIHELDSDSACCYGAFGFDYGKNENVHFSSKATIAASGGASGIYLRNTNPHTSTGDGIALAYQAGAEIGNMEFMQFHPTAFYTKSGKTFLISEAVRGEGAYLLNKHRERFMERTHESKELAPRDIVSRAIFQQMKETKSFQVYLDLRHLDGEKIRKRFSNIYGEALNFGIDITKEIVPVAPAAHYTIGGIRTGLHAETTIKGLFACGEVTHSGVHGANRLASNSLLECIVFGKRAVDAALQDPVTSKRPVNQEVLKFNHQKEKEFTKIKNRIAELMNDKVGIVRNAESMQESLAKLTEIEQNFNFEPNEYFSKRLRSLLSVSRLIINSAIMRKESRGTHIREDYPEESPAMLYYIIQQKDKQPKFLPINK